MYVKLIVVMAAILLLAGCGNSGTDAGSDVGIDNGAASGTNDGVDNDVDYEIPGPEPFEPSVCQCPELRAYLAGMPLIGDLFTDAEVTFQDFQAGWLLVSGAPAGPDPKYSELIELLKETIPGNNVTKQMQVGVYPEWRLALNPNPDSELGSFVALENIDRVMDFGGIKDPDSHDPEGVAAIEAEVIATLADLETALISIQEGTAPQP